MKRSIRQQEIYNLLRQNKYSSIQDLANHFRVTTTTIRRDLKSLEEDNIIVRSHGYVQIKEAQDFAINSFNERANVNIEEKKSIARAAYNLFAPKDSIIMDTGTCVYQLAVELADRPIKDIAIITNSLPVALQLADNNHVTLTGGILESWNLALIGPDAEAYFDKISSSKVFIGCTGVSEDALTANNPFHVSIKRKMIERSANVIALIDSSKFNVAATHAFCDFSKLAAVVTVKTKNNAQQIQKLIDQGVKVILA